MRRTIYVSGVVLALAAAACLCTGTSTSPTLEPVQPAAPSAEEPQGQPSGSLAGTPDSLTVDQIDAISRASVQIIAAQQVAGGNLEPLWTGSGTIISPTGEILTNCHVACGAPVLIVLMTTDVDQPPEPVFSAEITHYDEDLDLALLQVRTDMNGNPVSPSDLPYLEVGNSDDLRLGDKVYIFGYPGVGGSTITFTTGSVSGFESATVGGTQQRVIIKTDADIAGGSSGGTAVDLFGRLVAVPTAVNPDVREGVTLGGISMLRPINLAAVIRQAPGAPPPSAAVKPPDSDPDRFEPNNTFSDATGPVPAGETVEAFVSWEEDVDFYLIDVTTTQPIRATLSGPAGTDYDLYLVDGNENILASSETETSDETIQYTPDSAATYWIAVIAYSGATPLEPYTLTINYDGGSSGSGGSKSDSGIQLTGQIVDGGSGQPLAGGTFGVLVSGVSCSQFFGAPQLDLNQVVAAAETNEAGVFSLNGVPRGQVYSAFFIYPGIEPVCEDNWLDVPSDAVDSDLGVIEISTR